MQPSYPTGASRTHTGWRALGKPACVVTAVSSPFVYVAIVIAVEPMLVGRKLDNRFQSEKKTLIDIQKPGYNMVALDISQLMPLCRLTSSFA